MHILSPSILGADFNKLGEELVNVERAGSKYIHLDVMDGLFVPSISFGMPVIKALRNTTDMVFDVHLMINEPIRYVNEFKESGSDIITIHYEACSDVRKTLEEIKKYGLKAALAINPETPEDVLYEFTDIADMFLIMSVHPGFGGQKFIPESIEKIKNVRSYLNENNCNIDIEVDGGINLSNISAIIEAGANIIVAGSSVFKNDKAYDNAVEFMKVIDTFNQ